MKKFRFVSFIICVFLAVPYITVFADNAYYTYQNQYAAAQQSGDLYAMAAAVKGIESVYAYPSSKDEYNRLAWPCQTLAQLYEKNGYYDDALAYYQKALNYINWLNANGENYTDSVKGLTSVINHLNIMPKSYIPTTDAGDVPFYGAKAEPQFGLYSGRCNSTDSRYDSAYLLYVQFFNENISSFNYLIEQNKRKFTEIAWNVPNENADDLQRIANGSSDGYIIENLKFLSELTDTNILLRFGAEVNCWPSVPGDDAERARFIDLFKRAYIHISTLARTYAPNAAMVFSPNDISNWNVTAADFYPGDEYVDWIGVSAYGNKQAEASNEAADLNDAFYCRGVYGSEIVKIKDIMSIANKPVIISECGFSYSGDGGLQTEAYAIEQIKEFYTYVNMVYPQVKCIFYFDNNIAWEDRVYKLSDNWNVFNTYKDTLNENIAANAVLTGAEPVAYKTLSGNINKNTTVYTYAYYPTESPVTVTYRLDGVWTGQSVQAPYKYTIDISSLAQGTHTLSVTASCANTSRTTDYTFNVVSAPDPKTGMTDISGHWAYDVIADCIANSYFKGTSATTFEPESNMTRAMFVKVLANIDKCSAQDYTKTSYSDVAQNEWYYNVICWAQSNSIISSDTLNFYPDENITREDICVFFANYMKYLNKEFKSVKGENVFADNADISDYAAEAVKLCQTAGIVNGSDGNMFNPKSFATRAEVAAMTVRFCNLLK